MGARRTQQAEREPDVAYHALDQAVVADAFASDPVAEIIVHSLSKDLLSTFDVFRKAAAFETVYEHRQMLAAVNAQIQALQKKKPTGMIMSQLLGQKQQIERSIDWVFGHFSETK